MAVLVSCDVPTEDARTAATILILADLRGIDSHGVCARVHAHTCMHAWRIPGGAASGVLQHAIRGAYQPTPKCTRHLREMNARTHACARARARII